MPWDHDLVSPTLFLAALALGSLVQAVTGFALGLIALGLITAFGIAPTPFTTTVLSLVVLVNTSFSLRGHLHFIDRRRLAAILLGLVPGVLLGLLLLGSLDAGVPAFLRALLGIVLVASSIALIFKPHPLARPSSLPITLAAGLSGGILGGLFQTAGPPLIYLLYRQPVPVPVVRATLLASFWSTALCRSVLVGLQQGYDRDMLLTVAVALPLLYLTARLGSHWSGRLPQQALRRGAFVLLLLLGVSLCIPVPAALS
jgi:uncharacterized membrane protein YfcA